MSNGRERPDEGESHETYRGYPIGPGEEVPRTRWMETTRRHDDPHGTEFQSPGAGPAKEPPSAKSVTGSSPVSGTGTGGSFVESGTVVVEPGQVVFRKYQVLERLGRGGMGEVWLVRDVELEVNRALKMITQGSGFDTSVRARFKAEAKAMARLSHPNIVGVIDAKLDQQDVAYIVMEYVPGKSLEKILKPGQPMTVEWTGRLLAQLCDALQEAHDQGIVHRDLKPSNLILVEGTSRRDQLKVFDFGIAKILHVEDIPAESRTVAGAFMGTPPYASPEQADGRAVPASDIYSVGVILYEFLTGRRPFTGKSGSLIASTMHVKPPSFAEANPEANVPPGIEAVVMRCLAKKAEDRPQSPFELLEEFRAATTSLATPANTPIGSRMTAVTLPIAEQTGLTASTAVADPSVVPVVEKPRSRWLLPAAGLASVVALATVIVVVAMSRKLQPPPPPPPAKTLNWNNRNFTLWDGRIYLPDGYTADSGKDADGWPRTITRTAGRVQFVRMKGGTFTMGSRKDDPYKSAASQPDHEVTLPNFYIQKTEVTNVEIVEFLGHSETRPGDVEDWRRNYDQLKDAVGPEIADGHPATGLRYDFAARFARENQAYLPSEAEWEYAARSGPLNRVLVWDPTVELDKEIPILAHVFQEGSSNGVRTCMVGKYDTDRTGEGVRDLVGNVREWCRDPWRPYTEDAIPELPGPVAEAHDPGAEMVVRGGSYKSNVEARYTTYRENKGLRISEDPPADVGFRLVIEIPPPPKPPATAE